MESRRKKSSISYNVGKRKRALAVLMAILMIVAVTDYNGIQYASAKGASISIGGAEVDGSDWYAITDTSGTVATGGAISANYNIHVVKGETNGRPTATVTLKDAIITNSSNKPAINVEGYDLNIVLEGTSNQIGVDITSEYGDAIYSSTGNKVTITGIGDLALKGSYGINVNGQGEVNINTTGNLNIASEWQMVKVGGDITVSAKSIEATGYYFYGTAVSLTATDGDIHSVGSGQYCIQAGGDITVAAPNGAISVNGPEYAMKATDSSVNVAAENDVTLNGTVQGKEITITSETGNLTINGHYEAIQRAQTSVMLSAPLGDMLLNASGNSSIISGSNNFTLAITAGGKLEAKGPYGIQDYGSATIKADKVSVTNTTTGYSFNGGALTITNPSGGNCSEVYISGKHNNRDAINAFRDVNIKADKVMIMAGNDAQYAINASSIMGDVTVTIGDTGLIVGSIYIKGTNAISEGMLHVEKNGNNASYGLNLNTITPSQSTYYKAGDGYVIFTPGAGEAPATLLLNNATIHNQTTRTNNAIGMENEGIALPTGNIIIQVEGTNMIESSYGDGIGSLGSHVTLMGSGALTVVGTVRNIMLEDGSFSFADGADVTLNSVVSVRNDKIPQNTDTVYGNMTVNTYLRNLYGDAIITNGATVTIPQGQIFCMDETDSITINGHLINNGIIVLPYNYKIEQIKALKLTGNIWMSDGDKNRYRIYVNDRIYAYGGMVDYNFSINSAPTEVTFYQTTGGYVIFTPATGKSRAKLTFHNVDLFGDFTLPNIPLIFDLEGENTIESIDASASIIVEGSGKLDVYDFKNSKAGATLTVNSGATLNTKYNTTENNITTNTIYGNYTLSEDSRFYVGPSQNLVLLSGAVITLRYNGNLEFRSGTTLDDMTLGAGATIVNNTHIALPQGTTPEQIKALPLSGTGLVRITTAYDMHGYPDTWDIYTNDGLPITVVAGDDLELTETEVLASENKGYTWNKSGEGDAEVWTLTLNNTFINGRLCLPNEAIVINSTADSIIKEDICTNRGYAPNITFSGPAPLMIGGMIDGGIDGGTVTVQAGAKVTVDGSIFLGGDGGNVGTLNVTGKGTTLTSFSSWDSAVVCDSVYVQDGATMTAMGKGNDNIGIRATFDVSITGGSTLNVSGDYGIYITGGQLNAVDYVTKLTVDDSSKLITNCSVAPFCIVDKTSSKGERDVLSLAGIPSGTEIASVRGGEDRNGYTYWSLAPKGGSFNVTNESSHPLVTLVGAVSGELSFVKAKTSGGNGSSTGGSSSTGTPQPDAGTPGIKDASNKKGWEAIKEQISQTREGDTVTIEMNGSSLVSGEVLDAIRGTDTTLVFDMGDGITWSINGQSITDSSLNDVNLGVTLDTDAIPAELIGQMAGERAFSTLSLAYDGPFGFTSVLTINLNKINAGKYGNLFYYDPETKQLTLQAAEKIGAQGTVELPFSHASEYVVIISEEPMLEKTLEQIEISAVKGTLYVGGTKKKSMTLKLELPQLLKEAVEKDGSIQKITYKSSNSKVATVNASGKITAKKAGKTTVTTLVTIDGVQRTFQTKITVRKAYIKLIKSKKTLKTGSAFTYKAVGYGVRTEDIQFYTSKKSIVVINKKTGKAKAKTKGTDYIIAKAGKVKVKIKVKVS